MERKRPRKQAPEPLLAEQGPYQPAPERHSRRHTTTPPFYRDYDIDYSPHSSDASEDVSEEEDAYGGGVGDDDLKDKDYRIEDEEEAVAQPRLLQQQHYGQEDDEIDIVSHATAPHPEDDPPSPANIQQKMKRKRKRAVPTPRPEGAPKRPPGSYLLFLSHLKKEFPDMFKGMSAAQVGVVGGERWRAMSEEKKEPWVVLARQASEKYTAEKAVWQQKKAEEEAATKQQQLQQEQEQKGGLMMTGGEEGESHQHMMWAGMVTPMPMLMEYQHQHQHPYNMHRHWQARTTAQAAVAPVTASTHPLPFPLPLPSAPFVPHSHTPLPPLPSHQDQETTSEVILRPQDQNHHHHHQRPPQQQQPVHRPDVMLEQQKRSLDELQQRILNIENAIQRFVSNRNTTAIPPCPSPDTAKRRSEVSTLTANQLATHLNAQLASLPGMAPATTAPIITTATLQPPPSSMPLALMHALMRFPQYQTSNQQQTPTQQQRQQQFPQSFGSLAPHHPQQQQQQQQQILDTASHYLSNHNALMHHQAIPSLPPPLYHQQQQQEEATSSAPLPPPQRL